MSKLNESAYDWSTIPNDLPRQNLVLITAKTTNPTYHFTDPKYKIRVFNPAELKEAARSLAKRVVGLNHRELIENAFTVDAQWNESTQSVEALLFMPTPYINLIRAEEAAGRPVKFSVEYTWRDEVLHEDGSVEFIGLVFDRVDVLYGLSAGDKYTSAKLVEGKRGLMEAEEVKIKQDAIQDSVEDPSLSFFKGLEESANSFLQRLGEPFAGYTNFDDCLAKNKDKSNPSAYCGYIKHQVEDKKKKESKQIPEQPVNTMTTEQPAKLPVAIDQVVSPVNVTSVGAIPDNKGSPITPTPADTNPDKNLNQEPAKQVNVENKEELKDKFSPDKSNQSVECMGKLKESKEEVKVEDKPKEEVKVEEKKEDKPTEQKGEVKQETTPDPKDVRIHELEGVVTTLQNNAKVSDTEKSKAVKEATDKAYKQGKEEVINKIREVIPKSGMIGNPAVNATRRVIDDVNRKLYECTNKKEGE
jgi:hypothetical protein